MSEDANNLRFYIQSAEPPAEACKNFQRSGGFKGTDINAMWRIKQLTALFGPVGFGWYFKVTRREILQFDVVHQKCLVDIELYVKDPETGEWSMPILGTGGNDWVSKRSSGDIVVNDELYKMAITDALGNACKFLGFGASIYWAQDKSKYTVDEDGNYYEVVKTADEIKEEKAEARRQAAESFMPKRKTADTEAGFVTADKVKGRSEEDWNKIASECQKAIIEWIEADPLVNGGSEILGYYAKEHGIIKNWPAGLLIQCYKELVADGQQLRKVDL